jgi:hypothetical protein
MKKNQRAVSSDVKITAALKAMTERYSFTEYKRWCGSDIANEFKLGAAFSMVLFQLGAIQTKYGMVMLNEKINHLRPSTVRKRINEYVNTKRTTQRKTKKTTPVVPVQQTPSTEFNDLVIALKAKLKQEVMAELLASLK